MTLPPAQFADVLAYLSENNWQMIDENQRWRRWQSQDGYELDFPAISSFDDIRRRISGAIQELAIAEKRDRDLVDRDVRATHWDELSLRVISEETESGQIPLDQGLKVLESGRDLLLESAATTSERKAVFMESRPKEAREFVKSAWLDQTQRGSYVMRLVVPLGHGLFDFGVEEAPRSRAIMNHVASTINQLSSISPDAFNEAAENDHAKDPVVDMGLSANLCEAAWNVGAKGELDVDIGFRWARAIGGHSKVTHVDLPPEQQERCRQVGEKLREVEPEPNWRASGPIIHAIKGDVGDVGGSITIHHQFASGSSLKVRVRLGRREFLEAMDAMKEKKLVSVRGVLVSHGNWHYLEDQRDFKVHNTPLGI